MKAKAEEGYIDRCLEYLHNQNISVVLFRIRTTRRFCGRYIRRRRRFS